VNHHRRTYRLDELVLGFDGEHVHFTWRPYEERRPEAREGYDRLEADIRERGLLHPIITHRGHVLIGQRRVEILRKIDAEGGSFHDTLAQLPMFRPAWVVPCVEIDEDVSRWTAHDVFERLEAFKRQLYGADAEAWVA